MSIASASGMNNRKESWEASYRRKENYVFSPHEEVVRFFAKYITKRTGPDSFDKKFSGRKIPKVLDLGCGIGRHVIYANQMRAEAYGTDLSHAAIEVAREWAKKEGLPDPEKRIVQGDITALPYKRNFFDFIVSHGVLDSMSFRSAVASAQEAHRVLKHGGLFYCDLISGNDSFHNPNFFGEETVSAEHEKGTIQIYFNMSLIRKLFSGLFKIKEIILVRRTNLLSDHFISRYHIVLQKPIQKVRRGSQRVV